MITKLIHETFDGTRQSIQKRLDNLKPNQWLLIDINKGG